MYTGSTTLPEHVWDHVKPGLFWVILELKIWSHGESHEGCPLTPAEPNLCSGMCQPRGLSLEMLDIYIHVYFCSRSSGRHLS
jgi:hypothetical protein